MGVVLRSASGVALLEGLVIGCAIFCDGPNITQRVPVLVQTSVQAEVPPRAITNA